MTNLLSEYGFTPKPRKARAGNPDSKAAQARALADSAIANPGTPQVLSGTEFADGVYSKGEHAGEVKTAEAFATETRNQVAARLKEKAKSDYQVIVTESLDVVAIVAE